MSLLRIFLTLSLKVTSDSAKHPSVVSGTMELKVLKIQCSSDFLVRTCLERIGFSQYALIETKYWYIGFCDCYGNISGIWARKPLECKNYLFVCRFLWVQKWRVAISEEQRLRIFGERVRKMFQDITGVWRRLRIKKICCFYISP